MATYTLNAEERTLSGKQVGRLRRDGKVPAVLYGHGIKPLSLTLTLGELEKVYRQAGGSSVVGVKLPNGEQNVLIHDVQHDPRTGKFLHADLFQVKMDEKIKATVPLQFEGTSPAVRELDGVLVTNLNEVEVECLPGILPPEITVNIDSLKTFEDAITVADLKVAPGVEILNEAETNVASVSPPRTEAELEALDEEVEEAAEPEVEGEEKAEGEEGEEGEAAEGGAEGDKGKDQGADAKGDKKDQKKD